MLGRQQEEEDTSKNADNGRQCRQWQITKVLFMVSVLNHATGFFS
jgi:hypothetical protein